MCVVNESIDLNESNCERFKNLKNIINNILVDTDPDPGVSKDRLREWICWHFLYIIWWEGHRATTRKQGGGGPARGVMQMEPLTLRDIIRNYILGSTSRFSRFSRLIHLAKATGVTTWEMKRVLENFKHVNPGKNTWPDQGDARKVEDWLLNIDSFGIKLMRYYFKQFIDHKFPPQNGDLDGNPQDEKFKEEHAEGWAKWWKKKFKDDDEEIQLKEKFKNRARELDRLAADSRCT